MKGAILGTAGFAIAVILLLASVDAFMDIESVQQGYDGVAMELNYDVDELKEVRADNEVPVALPPASDEGLRASEAYENVQVLGDLTTGQFTRLMTSITQWVSPEQGCNYCHNANNLASDDVYTKIVSRRMIQMTQYINSEWESKHVKNAGVTCYTCHRGLNVPQYIWFEKPESPWASALAGDRAQQNEPAESVALASLPADPFTPFLNEDYNIRIQGNQALPHGNRRSIKQAEWTYGLMMHMSESMGVNCTYCHNSRAFGRWEQSPPTRVSAWHGIRMVRALNNEYLEPLQGEYPDYRLGPTGDAPKANCTTCHQGAYKPLLGANMLKDFPSLSAPDYYADAADAYRKAQAEKAAAEAAEAEAEAQAEAEAEAGEGAEAPAETGADVEGDAPPEADDEVDDMFEPTP